MVAVISRTGIRLMPTTNYRARKLLKSRRAEIHKYDPFTIRLLDREDGDLQPIEFKMDTGYQHIGVSICTEKRELYSEQRDLLTDEPERHNDRRKYRSSRRNRKTRYRKPRFDNRAGLVWRDGFAPSIRNKRDRHIDIFLRYIDVIPVTSAIFEMGQFDTQLLKALAEGKEPPRGTDYQHGERYRTETLREAVFTRDGYRCICCGRTPFRDRAILHVHHLGFWKAIPDRSNRLSNLATVCEKCHTSKNHKPGGKLHGLKPKLKPMAGATFMTAVRFDMFEKLKKQARGMELHMAYGAGTKLSRKQLSLKKSHANDAYSMGRFHPEYRADTIHYRKRRRNNRILSKFYDAKYIDTRDGSTKKGSQLSCGRVKRSMSRRTELNERIYRGRKVSAGKTVARHTRYPYRPGDRVTVAWKQYEVCGTFDYGKRVRLDNGKSVSTVKIQRCVHCGGWKRVK